MNGSAEAYKALGLAGFTLEAGNRMFRMWSVLGVGEGESRTCECFSLGTPAILCEDFETIQLRLGLFCHANFRGKAFGVEAVGTYLSHL